MLHFCWDMKQTLGVIHQNWNLKGKKPKVFHITLSRKLHYNFSFCFVWGFCWVFDGQLRSAVVVSYFSELPGLLETVWLPGQHQGVAERKKKNSSRSGRVVGVARWLSQMSRKQPKGSSNLANGLVQPWALNLQSSSVAQGHIELHPQNWIISSFLLLTPVSLV